MKADDTKLRRLLEGTIQYFVPLYQRVYSWDKEAWDELWDDLLDIYYDERNDRQHFMGAIVTVPHESQPHDVSKYLLIDGQQRLTTLLIILACIRDLLRTTGQKKSEEIENLYLTNQYKDKEDHYKLLPTQADRKGFCEIVEGMTRSASNLGKVYNYFHKKLTGNDNDGNPIDHRKLSDTIINQLVFVSIILDKGEDPHRIFHSLNGTGAPLTQADLVRNHIFMRIPEVDHKTAYYDMWLPIQESFSSKELREFLWRFITKDGVPVRQNGVYDEIRNRLATDQPTKTANTIPPDANNMLLDLKIYSEHYKKILVPSKEPNAKIRTKLERLNQWGLTTVYPLLLNLYRAWEKSRIEVQAFCEVLDIIEAYVVRRHICNVPIRSLTNIFIRMFKEINEKPDIVSAAGDYLRKRNFPTDEVFRDNWERSPIYDPRGKSKLILETLEAHIQSNNEPVDLKHPRITQEHIMPQQLSDKWRIGLGERAEEIHSLYLDTIGNLTLTGRNESMGNKTFSEKKKVFANSSLAMNSYFETCDVWNEDEIKKRGRYLGDMALKIWKRP